VRHGGGGPGAQLLLLAPHGRAAGPALRPPARPYPGGGGRMRPLVDDHLTELIQAVRSFRHQAILLSEWGRALAEVVGDGGRLLVAGNGGSAAQAQHLTAELVGKLRADRVPLSALALHAETSSTSAIGDDFGFAEIYARQVRAHGRPGDVLLLLSTSGRSPNL